MRRYTATLAVHLFMYQILFTWPLSTTAFAIECGKCSSRHAAIRSNSSASVFPLKETDIHNSRLCFGKRTGLIKDNRIRFCHCFQILSALHGNMVLTFASRIADNTAMGIASFNAQEKSTISTDSAFVTFLVNSHTRAPVPAECIRHKSVGQVLRLAFDR